MTLSKYVYRSFSTFTTYKKGKKCGQFKFGLWIQRSKFMIGDNSFPLWFSCGLQYGPKIASCECIISTLRLRRASEPIAMLTETWYSWQSGVFGTWTISSSNVRSSHRTCETHSRAYYVGIWSYNRPLDTNTHTHTLLNKYRVFQSLRQLEKAALQACPNGVGHMYFSKYDQNSYIWPHIGPTFFKNLCELFSTCLQGLLKKYRAEALGDAVWVLVSFITCIGVRDADMAVKPSMSLK